MVNSLFKSFLALIIKQMESPNAVMDTNENMNNIKAEKGSCIWHIYTNSNAKYVIRNNSVSSRARAARARFALSWPRLAVS